MCDCCDCDEYLKCSVYGFQRVGFCCDRCTYYVEGAICSHKVEKPEIDVVSFAQERLL